MILPLNKASSKYARFVDRLRLISGMFAVKVMVGPWYVVGLTKRGLSMNSARVRSCSSLSSL